MSSTMLGKKMGYYKIECNFLKNAYIEKTWEGIYEIDISQVMVLYCIVQKFYAYMSTNNFKIQKTYIIEIKFFLSCPLSILVFSCWLFLYYY